MPVHGRGNTTSNNLVANLPNLPVPITVGTVSASLSFESNPTATIEYQQITLSEITNIESAYRLGSTLILYGVKYVVARFGYERVAFPSQYERINLYNASVSLEGVAEKAARSQSAKIPAGSTQAQREALMTKTLLEQRQDQAALVGYLDFCTIDLPEVRKMNEGRTWVFSEPEILVDGKNEIVFDFDGYDRAELSWEQTETNAPVNGPATVFTLPPPTVKVLKEFSDKYNEPPENSVVLKDLSNNFDESGQKKVYKETRVVNGNPERETISTYGFAYNKADIATPEGDLFYDQPIDFWNVVEYQQTDYIYRKNSGTKITVKVQQPDTAQPPSAISDELDLLIRSSIVDLVVHPDYEDFIEVSIFSLGDQEITVFSTTEYLVEIVTTGWKLVRFLKEAEGDDGTLDPENPKLSLYLFRKIPFFSRTVYVLRTARKSGDKVDPPFRIEWVQYDALEPRVKAKVNPSQNVTRDGRVGLIYPDPNYSIPLKIFAQYDAANSFAATLDPEEEEDNNGNIKRYTTGQETRNEVERTIIDPDYYSERIVDYSSQDPGFDNAIESISFRYTTGTLPDAQTRRVDYEQKIVPVGQTVAKPTKFRYWVTTDNNSKYVQKGGSVNITGATSLEQALEVLQIQLRKTSVQASQSSKTIAWFYPTIRPGDTITFGSDRFQGEGKWRVMSLSWTLDYKGGNTPLGQVVTCDGTQVTVGLDKKRGVRIQSEKLPPEIEGNEQDPALTARLEGEGFQFSGRVMPVLQTRRNF